MTQCLAGLPAPHPAHGPRLRGGMSPPPNAGGPQNTGLYGFHPPSRVQAGVTLPGAKPHLNKLSLSHGKSGQESRTSKQHHPRGHGNGRQVMTPANPAPGKLHTRHTLGTRHGSPNCTFGPHNLNHVLIGMWV